MNLLVGILIAAAAPAPEHAQHDGHGAEQAGHGAEHAGHRAEPVADHAGHAGHADGETPEQAPVHASGHAAHHGAATAPEHAADAVYSPEAMARARAEMIEEHGGMETAKLLIDRLELRGDDGYAWDAEAWWGGDIDKLWLKSEGEGRFGEAVESAEVQALWSHAIGPFFDLQAGARYDLRPDPERAYAVLGVQGLAPYWFEVDAAAFLSDRGDLSARVEAEYDLRLTQRLILQPRGEIDVAFGDGSEAAVGARLRYELSPLFAPYVGVEYRRAFGDAADDLRAEGEGAGEASLLVGIRTWF